MKIEALRLFNVKRFANRGVAIEGIGDGVNVLCAANEFGKSTSFEALHALFFQSHSGTPGDVQKLRPYSGGSPLVEADIATAEGRFRITKQYYGGRFARVTDLASGRLVAQADQAENFIAGLIKGGTAGPAGLLWVRQGITGIEKRSRSEEDSEKQVRASLLESVQGEVEAVTGGRRMAEIMAATQEALAELVTATGRPKAGGRYAAAIEARDRLVAQEQRLADDVRALREALDRRAVAAKRLAELEIPDERQARRQAVAAAQAAFDAAKAQGETLRVAEAELGLVRELRDGAQRDLTRFQAALGAAQALGEKLSGAERSRGEAVGRRHAAVAAIEAATAEIEAAETGERDTRDLLARLDAALKAREAGERHAALAERLREAEATRQAVEDGEARQALAAVPAATIDELQALEIDIARLRAVEEAARPSVAIAYEAGAAAAVTMDDTPLAGGEERGYDGQAQLAIPGIGTLTLRANRPARSDGRRNAAEAKRRTLLAAMGVDTLDAARERQFRAQQIDAELREWRGRLALLAPQGLASLREEVAAQGATRAEALELKDDPVQVRAALGRAEERRTLARQALREVQPLRAGADEAFVTAETALAALRAERAQVEAILGPEDSRGERERALASRLDLLAGRCAAAEAQVAGLRAGVVDIETVEAALRRARSVEDAADKEASALREAIAGLNAEIRARSDEAVEESWGEAREALAAANTRAEAFAAEVRVLQRLASALDAARSQARELYLKPVMTELKPLLGLLFDDAAITFDDKTLLPQSLRRNGHDEDVERLSGGMREQLSVLTRLAFARLLARDGRPAPVILDDALVYSDDDRIERMFDALHRQSRDQQIIVFSCRQRAFQRLGGHVLTMTDWQP
ncbi:AAA family ATPase [Ancylobacter dichloromethanicus]|uniref:GTP-binding protein n=1 Tax=Ancylobacter dichloromethanicus TaxID=518825 RepID=A0A9W6JBI3_9HYPH|nr:AAA family ATPase [Ancylobacter dichloromethanicus]MBS7553673.1 AAA family ATPase [Ancylobacter dichloromethanicus]GLK72739.1 GTP-binding protein [Ancylobacter dichloromethanicus]